MTFDPTQLQAIARTYWPADDLAYFKADAGPEHIRLRERWKQALEKIDDWHAFLGHLRAGLPGFIVGDATSTFDACFRCTASLEACPNQEGFRRMVVGCVSILVPAYMIYGVSHRYEGKTLVTSEVYFDELPSEMRRPADVISKSIENTFHIQRFPRELAAIRVPLFVEPQQPPGTTLFHALFASLPESLP